MKRLFPYFLLLKPYWFAFLIALVCGVIYGVSSGFGLPYMIDQVFPIIFPGEKLDVRLSTWELFMYISWFPLVFIIRGTSSYFNSYFINYCGIRVLEKIRFQVFGKLQRLPISFFHRNQEGDLLSRMISDTGQLQAAILQVSNDLIKQPITFIGAITALIVMAVQREGMAFVLLCLLVIPICVFPIRRIGELLLNKALNMQEKAGNLTSILSENLSAYKEVRAFNLESREKERFLNVSENFIDARMKVIKYSHMLTPLIEIITAVGISAAIFQASRKSIQLDAVVPVIVALYMSYEPVKKLGGIHTSIKQALASLERLEEILETDESISNPTEPTEIKMIRGELEFNNVSYSYSNREEELNEIPALIDINLKISSGEVVALVGPSGGGKSTLAGLLPRFYDPEKGSVLLDGMNLRDFSLHDVRDAVALVPQKPFLFDLDVEKNIELGKSKYTDATINEVCQLAYADEFINEFEQGYQERLGEKGSRLSGGQLQRLALARAFFKNSPLLVLDEATSALDAENEDKIHEAMAQLIKGKTTLLIAHRFSSLKLASRILVMDKGRIIADGPHDEVYKNCDLYRTLYDQQNEGLS
ncbi:ABC transporter ATP-binding protein [Candidatus Seribacter sulfatis]|uniref:ABC transporter ATP-binding protein n=1 Tax=Candidatus Seribacter sulfatis TaxID=3381756 RepID=UPI003899A831